MKLWVLILNVITQVRIQVPKLKICGMAFRNLKSIYRMKKKSKIDFALSRKDKWLVIVKPFPYDWFVMRHRVNATLIGKAFKIDYYSQDDHAVISVDRYVMPVPKNCMKTFEDELAANIYSAKINLMI